MKPIDLGLDLSGATGGAAAASFTSEREKEVKEAISATLGIGKMNAFSLLSFSSFFLLLRFFHSLLTLRTLSFPFQKTNNKYQKQTRARCK